MEWQITAGKSPPLNMSSCQYVVNMLDMHCTSASHSFIGVRNYLIVLPECTGMQYGIYYLHSAGDHVLMVNHKSQSL